MIALKPGLMIALATKIDPPPVYHKRNEETERPPGAEVRTWESEVVVQLPEEYERAKKARGKARSLLTGACIITPFHVLMCPFEDKDKLDRAEAEAREVVRAFNDSATFYRVELQTFRGQVEEDSQRAAQAVGDEVRGLLDSMERSIRLGDVKAARDAATQAKSLGRLLEGKAAERVSLAVKGVRKLAREIVDRVQGQAEQLADVLTEERLHPIAAARVVFLEADQLEDVPSPAASPKEIGAFLDGMHAGLEAGPVGTPEFEEAARPFAELATEPPVTRTLNYEVADDLEPDDDVDPVAIERMRTEAMQRLGIPAAAPTEQPAEESLDAARSLMQRFSRPVAAEEEEF